jgi:acyl-[acyl-carrier-protein]-phospholipid O-acyltransferase / long-chain-fatty-acid--[acyl-carrier-protein] ligase
MKSGATLALANEELAGRNSRQMPPPSPQLENPEPEALLASVSTDAETRSAPRSLAGFWSLIVTQFQGAFSDNVLKNLVIFMILGASAGIVGDAELAREHRVGEYVTALFSLPFILFSMAGGFLADRLSKRTVMVGVKVFEIFVMTFVLLCFWLGNINLLPRPHVQNLLLAAIFLMGTHSAFFGPSKYSSLPELLPEKKLSWGNGILELGTFMAIILGTLVASVLSEKFGDKQIWSGLILIALALLGLGASLGITRVPAANPGKKFQANFVRDLFQRLQPIRKDRPLVLALIGNVYFSFLGSLLLLNLFFYGHGVLHVSKIHIGYLSAALALGIGTGSIAAGYLSGGKIEYGLVPLGALGMSAVCFWLALPAGLASGLLRLALLGFAGGFFIVPISALLQHRPTREKKGEVLAAANLLSFVGVFLVWPVHYFLTQIAKFNPLRIFLFGGVLTLIGAIVAAWLLPDALLRFILWVLTRTLYRIRVVGRDHIPERGGALFVCNHLSKVDALLLQAAIDRPIRFLMYKGIYELPHIKPLARIMGVIPISSEQRPREMLQSLQTASEAIKAGEIVCIFAEGQITRIGQMLPFRRGFERIMKDQDAPIIPVALDGVWGSIFSFEKRRFLWKLPRRIPYPVTINFGKPMPATSNPFQVRQVVQELQADAWTYRKQMMQPLHREFLHSARRHPFRFAMADSQSKPLNFVTALMRAIFIGRRLKAKWQGQNMVGILLPPSVPGALVNFAALMSGRVPVNLNYTVSDETLASCIRQCNIETVVTAKAFLEKVKLTIPCTTILLEDAAEKPSFAEKVGAFLSAWLLPGRTLERTLGAGKRVELDDLATVIFSSGSTGEPKGVMLSHYNIGSNIRQLEQVFGFDDKDTLLGVLPFFHSFGFTGTLCLPAVLGGGVVYHANPLDAKTIGPLVSQYAVTFLLATPTFLQLYMRGCAPADFGSLRLIMTGAEKLPDRLASAFEEQFGIRPLEAYGCTECAPAVAVNTHDFRSAGFRQVGGKRGKIGHPLPGVSIRIMPIEAAGNGVALGQGQSGVLLVRGPNVMQGYLGKPEKTAEVLHDGWYNTGDVAAIDEDGFLQITDRLNRFSKIGGEMVPHIKIEEKLHEVAAVTEQTFVVTGVPDEKKGERLIVLHKLPGSALKDCLEKFAACDLPNLWKPRADQFFHLDLIPYLGTGKLDLRKIKDIAGQMAAARVAG